MEEYKAGSISSLLGGKKQKKSKDKLEKSETEQLFAVEHNQEKVRQTLSARLTVLNELAKNVREEKKKPRKRKLNSALFEREASLREADEGKPKKKKKKEIIENREAGDNDDADEQKDEKKKSQENEKSKPKRDRVLQRENRLLKKRTTAKNKRTLFVGNVPVSATKKGLMKIFKQYGKIESLRFRSAAPADLKLPKRATVIKKEFHEKRQNLHAYVVFVEASSARKALAANGTMVDNLHIRVDLVHSGKDVKEQFNPKLSVFIGNLPFDVEEEAIREHFEDCGEVDGVRIIRDSMSGLGKGFGFVLFKDSGAVDLALRLNDQELNGRSIRVMRSSKQKRNMVKQTRNESQTSRAGHGMRLPTNMPKKSFEGFRAKKKDKIKKKLQLKKKWKGKKTFDQPENKFSTKKTFDKNHEEKMKKSFGNPKQNLNMKKKFDQPKKNFKERKDSHPNKNFKETRDSHPKKNFKETRDSHPKKNFKDTRDSHPKKNFSKSLNQKSKKIIFPD